jgi:glycerol-3-phosphate dehydrogenase
VSQAERLCVDMVKEACAVHPETIALNYVEVQREDETTVKLTDQASGEAVLLQPDVVVNATGAWIDFTNAKLGVESGFMGGTKGSHLVIDNKKLYDALGDRMVYYEHSDGRVCITFRFLDKVIMGSTDIKVENPDDAECEQSEVDYMITTLKGAFPDLQISPDEIVYQFCGVRPLPASRLEYTSRVSRSHLVETSPPDDERSFPIHSLIGGKLTTFGAFAREVTDDLLTELGTNRRKNLDEVSYLGAVGFPESDEERQALIRNAAAQHQLTEDYVGHLFSRYGMETETLMQEKTKDLAKPLRALPDYSVGEIAWIVDNECVGHLMDLVRRRSVIALLGNATADVLAELAEIAGKCLGWDAGRQKQEVAEVLAEARRKDS